MADWTYHVSLAITQTNPVRILLIPQETQWTLPRFTLQTVFVNLFLLSHAIKDELGAEMSVLRPLVRQRDEAAHLIRAIWLMENHSADWFPPDGSLWADQSILDGLELVDEWMRPTLTHTLNTLMDAPPVERPSWFQAGWFRQVQTWITETLTAHGYTVLRPPEQFKHWAISSVLRVETTSGYVFFKVSVNLPLLGNEPKLSVALGQLYPHAIPAPLIIDEERQWMLTSDFGNQLAENINLTVLEKVMRIYAQIQIDASERIDALFGLGCLDRRLNVLAGQIDALLADEAAYIQLNDEERAAWKVSGDQLKALCQQLAGYNIPYTLVHGDFHTGNIAIKDEQLTIFDWTDACVAHPFFDPSGLIEGEPQEHREMLENAYLSQWTAYEPIERLREAYDLAKILTALHQAVTFRGIFNGVERDQRQAWEFGVPMFAREILGYLHTKI